MLEALSLDELEALIKTMEDWFREDAEIEEARYDDKSYESPEAFLEAMEQHRLERTAMAKLLKAMEEERDRRKTDSGPV